MPTDDDPFAAIVLDTPDALKADLGAVPEVRQHLEQETKKLVQEFLESAAKAAARVCLMNDPWKARQVMVDLTLWLVELNDRLNRELTVLERPRYTSGAFKR